jgi:hypothetical protein
VSKVKKKIDTRISELQREFKRQMITLVTGAIAFVAALFWRDAIQEIFSYLLPKATTWPKFISAVIVSLFAVTIIIILTQFTKEKNKT